MKKTKDFSFARFFNPHKSATLKYYSNNFLSKHHGRLVWLGNKTYIRAIHGELK